MRGAPRTVSGSGLESGAVAALWPLPRWQRLAAVLLPDGLDGIVLKHDPGAIRKVRRQALDQVAQLFRLGRLLLDCRREPVERGCDVVVRYVAFLRRQQVGIVPLGCPLGVGAMTVAAVAVRESADHEAGE